MAALPLLQYPQGVSNFNVRDFGARGDGVTDDSRAIQRALDSARKEVVTQQPDFFYPRPKTVFFPAGTYRVSATLAWVGQTMMLMGQGPGHTVIRLADGAAGFADSTKPAGIFKSPDGNYQFRNYIRDMTLSVGNQNPGAMGVDFIANNSGGLRNLEIRSEDGQGFAGVGLMRAWPGPMLVKQVSVKGFAYGIRVGHAEFAPTFEDISISGQAVAGIYNHNNILPIRKLTSDNKVPALVNIGGMVVMLDATLEGGTPSAEAIINRGGRLYLRGITSKGYRSPVREGDSLFAAGPVAEYFTGPARSLFSSPARSLGLPVRETPHFHSQDTSDWVRLHSPGWYGDNRDWQDKINSGKSTIWWSTGTYLAWDRVFTVPRSVRRFIGFGAVLNGSDAGRAVTLQVSDGDADSPPLIVEHIGYGMRIEHKSRRPVVLKHGKYTYVASPGAGDLHLEDVEMQDAVYLAGQRVWARQYNNESPTNNIVNQGADLWILGIKTERKGLVVRTTSCGNTELLGGLLYPTQSFHAGDPPAFTAEGSNLTLVYGVSSYVNNGIYPIQVRHARGQEVRELAAGQLTGRYMPLYAGIVEDACLRTASLAPENSNHMIPSVGRASASHPLKRILFSVPGGGRSNNEVDAAGRESTRP